MQAFLLLIRNTPLLGSGGKEQYCSVKVGFAERLSPDFILFPLLIRTKIPADFSEMKFRLKLMAFENLLFTSFGSIF